MGAEAFLTFLNSPPLKTGPTATHPSGLVFLCEWGGASAALRNRRRTPLGMLPARQCCLPLSAHSKVHHTFSSALLLTEPALAPHLASHLGTCEPVAKREPAEPGPAAPPLSMPTQLPVILGTPVCPCCSLSSSGTASGLKSSCSCLGGRKGLSLTAYVGKSRAPSSGPRLFSRLKLPETYHPSLTNPGKTSKKII